MNVLIACSNISVICSCNYHINNINIPLISYYDDDNEVEREREGEGRGRDEKRTCKYVERGNDFGNKLTDNDVKRVER